VEQIIIKGGNIVDLKRLVLGKRKIKKLNKSQLRMLKTFEFLVRLLLLSIPLYLIIGFGMSSNLLKPLQASVAGQSGWVLEQMGYRILYDDVFITAYSDYGKEPFNFMINEDCTGWKSMLFLFALMFAVPAITMRKRLIGLVIGVIVIWIGNIARVVGVVLAERAYGVEVALLVHDYLWQVGLICLVLVIWLVWLYWVKRKKKLTFYQRLRRLVRWRA
jgi:exosortase/archaeosortase family protein